MADLPRILMCAPDFYGIEYEINPWMNRERQSDHELAVQQWSRLKEILQSLGAEIEQLDPVQGLPDLVFTANAAMIYGHQAVLSRFRHVQRQGEEEHDANWLSRHGFDVLQLPEQMYFEGAGDALFCGDTLFAGYRKRSDAKSHQRVGKLIGCRVIPLELVDPYYYHLDTCFCPVAGGVAIYYPGAFDDYGRRVLAELVPQRIEVEADEAPSFACNAVVVGRTVVTNIGCPGLHARLKDYGFAAIETPLSEFVKAGGSAKCLTLRLDGEEAAGWRSSLPGDG
jgi:N-dimethylarginine dimethylaminohydrolase